MNQYFPRKMVNFHNSARSIFTLKFAMLRKFSPLGEEISCSREGGPRARHEGGQRDGGQPEAVEGPGEQRLRDAKGARHQGSGGKPQPL